MPLYEYLCKKCGHRFERIQLFSAAMVKKCPECGGKVEQMISAPAVQFKGSGWYVNDYGKGNSKEPKPKHDASNGGGKSEGDGAKSEKGSGSTSGSESSGKSESSSKSSKSESSGKTDSKPATTTPSASKSDK